GHRHQFEEAAPGILRVSQPRGGLDQRRAAKEISNLHNHESQEKEVQQTQHDSHFKGTQGKRREAFFQAPIKLLPKQQSAQVPTDREGNGRDNYQVGEVNMQDAVDEVLEDRVRSHQEG